MSDKVSELTRLLDKHRLATHISQLWCQHDDDRRPWLDQKKELRNYVFATDTTTTTNNTLPWTNKTTIPKLCQIRDNLHANYSSALFPNDNWVKWEAHGKDAGLKEKRLAAENYIQNKCRLSNFRTEISKLLYDYIDYGNAFYDVIWVDESTTDPTTEEEIPGYVGPKLVRLSPLDIVFNPLAPSFEESYNVTRYLKSLGDLRGELDSQPDLGYNKDILDKADSLRKGYAGFSPSDYDKMEGMNIDGFGSFYNYLQSGMVEVLEFQGCMYDPETGEYLKNYIITVIDRCWVVRKEQNPSWIGKTMKGHVGWRLRPDNAYAMGPLDNLVGMQYRIDHLENLKADAMDLAVHPPLVISGNVEEFTYQPREEILASEGASIVELGKNLNGVISAASEIATLELKMEEMAGAPKQAMGIRTPGEKTAFEIQTLEMAASRIFQNKITHFEVNLVEPALNKMLELARRKMNGADIIRVMSNDYGVAEFLSITKEDIASNGKLRAVGARHFAADAVRVQNLMAIVNSGLWQDPTVRAHISGKKIAYMIEEMLGLDRFEIVKDNAALFENAETQQLQSQIAESIQMTNMTPLEEEDASGVV